MTKNGTFPALTGIRAIAAYMVFIHHNNWVKNETIHKFFNEFHVGVTIFFVLSGFLITYRYFDHEKMNFKNYWVNRFSRIYPLYFILTTLTFIYFAFKAKFFLNDYFLNITFLRGFFDSLKFSGIAQGWSLTVEECFYFVAPLFFICIRKNKISLLLLPIFMVLSGYFIVHFFSNTLSFGFMSSNDFMLDFTFFGRCFEFFIGMGLAILILRGKHFSPAVHFTYIGFFFTIGCVFWLSIINPSGGGTDMFLGKIINTILLPLFGIAPMLYGFVSEKTIVSRILSTSFFQLLGKSSYAFYLIHLGIFIVVLNKVSTNLFFQFIALNIVAIALYSFLEHPLNLFIRKQVK